MQANHPQHFAGLCTQRDECHRPSVIELGKARDKIMAEGLERSKETQPDVFWSNTREEVMIQPFIFRPYRTNKQRRSIGQCRAALPFLWIWSHSEPRIARSRTHAVTNWRNSDTRVDSENSVLVR